MQIRRSWILPVIAIAMLWCGTALGVTHDPDASTFVISTPDYPLIRQPTNHFAANDAIERVAQRYGGNWHVHQWNQFSRTPDGVYGTGIALAGGGLGDDQAAQAAAHDFVAANADILGADIDDLSVTSIARGLGKVAVHFQQHHHGVPVVGGRVRTLFTETGTLTFFGSSFYGDIDLSPVPLVGAEQAEQIAIQDLPFNLATDGVDGAPELLVLPVHLGEGGADYLLVWHVTVMTSEPYGRWETDVDARDGTILKRVNGVHSVFSGTSEGLVDNPSYCETQDTLPFREMTISVAAAGSDVTDASGGFSIAGGGGNSTVTAQFDGPQQNVNNSAGADASFSSPITDGVPFTINWTDVNSNRAERDCFYWVNETDAFVKGIDGTYNHGKYTCNVNVNQTCNANWNGNVMNFFREGGGCANTGELGDVMAHEFGHGVQSDLIGSQGGEGLGEGNGDILSNFMVDESIIGRGFFLGNCVSGIRDCNNALSYPGDVVGQEIHFAGQVICGVTWDARLQLETKFGTALGKATMADIWHFARKLNQPTNQPDQVLAYFLADDDDGNLDNGTPNHAELCVGATNHGFSCPEILVGVLISHEPLPSTTDHASAFTVSADIVTTVETGSITVASLFYRIDGGGFVEVAMVNTAGDTFEADIPAQAMDASIEYYIFGQDSENNTRTDPAAAPAVLHQFFVATVIDELEAASGWTVGAPGDNATTGIWERVDPIGTQAQPGNDHTPDPGVLCFVTGQCSGPNCGGGCTLGCNDIDGGQTTLVSPVWDLSSATAAAVVSYYRWYSNNTGASPNADFWVVDVSNDGGGSWTNVENVNPPNAQQNNWQLVQVDLIALFGSPDQVQLRFIGSDNGNGSLVEAAVDDLIITTQGGAAAIETLGSPDAAGRFALNEPRPNPFNPSTEVSYEIAGKGRVLVAIYDASGRQVRTLVEGVQEAGAHSIQWDGRDDAGRTLASGVYHVRMTSGASEATQKMVLLK